MSIPLNIAPYRVANLDAKSNIRPLPDNIFAESFKSPPGPISDLSVSCLNPFNTNQMPNQQNFNTPKAPRMSQAFPQAVIAGNFIFISGTPGYDLQTGKVISDNFED